MDEITKSALYLLGGGGITTLLVAWFGWRSKHEERLEHQAPPAQHADSMWLIQNLLEMKLEVEGIRRGQDTLTKAVGDLAIQVNTIGALLKRHRSD